MKEEDLILIEKYFSDSLTKDEHALFESRKNDPDFLAELTFQEDLKKVNQVRERRDIHKVLQSEERRFLQDRKTSGMRSFWLRSVAAVFLIAVIGFTIWSTSRQVSGEELYARFYTAYPNSISPLTKGSQELEMDGYQAYELGRYDQAIRLLSKEDSDTARFYRALAELGSLQTENAEVLLSNIASVPGYYQIPARWYLALINLKQEEFTEAREHLQQVKNSSHPLSQRADDLLSILEQD